MKLSNKQINLLGYNGKKLNDESENTLFNNYRYGDFSLSLLNENAELMYKDYKLTDLDINSNLSYEKNIDKISTVVTYLAYYQYVKEEIEKLDKSGYNNLPEELRERYIQLFEAKGKMNYVIKSGCNVKESDLLNLEADCYAFSKKRLNDSIVKNIKNSYDAINGNSAKEVKAKTSKLRKFKKINKASLDREF